MNVKYRVLLAVLSLCSMTSKAQSPAHTESARTLIVFFDGLRPDYITAADMPRLHAFKQQACYGTQHHSVFPTVTRVNSSSYSTGSYPATHGLMGNAVFFPEVDKLKALNTGEAGDLKRIDSATGGHLLTTTASLAQALAQAGKRFMVFSSGSTGQAYLQNHSLSGGMIINPSMILPESSRQSVIDAVGAPPAGGKSGDAGHAWITDALMTMGLTKDGPLVNAIWYGEPDGAAHRYGIGSPEAKAALKIVDAQFGRIIDSLKGRGMHESTNILISTDHGFVTYVGKQSLTPFLIQQGLKKDTFSDDVIVAEGAIYVKDHDPVLVQKIVTALQSQPWIGPLFTRARKPGNKKGGVRGTLSFESIHWNHPNRAADILVANNWDDRPNSVGYAGASYSTGVAGHGGLSPYEVHIPLMASGPAFRKSFNDSLPTSNVDLVPTVLHIHGIAVPAVMDGRVMSELLNEPAEVRTPTAIREVISDEIANETGSYRIELHRTLLGKYYYVDFAKIIRTMKSK